MYRDYTPCKAAGINEKRNSFIGHIRDAIPFALLHVRFKWSFFYGQAFRQIVALPNYIQKWWTSATLKSTAMKRDLFQYVLQVRKDLAAAFRALPLLKRSRAAAIVHYFTLMEAEVFKIADAPGQASKKAFVVHRKAVESSSLAIPAIFDFCPVRIDLRRISEEMFAEAYELYNFSYKYEQVEYCMRLAEKGHFRIVLAEDAPRLTFVYSSSESNERDTLLRSGEIARRLFPTESSVEATAFALLENILTGIRDELQRVTVRTGPEEITYTYSERLLREMRQWTERLSYALRIEMPDEIAVGGVSFVDLRQFWGALICLSNVHQIAHYIAAAGDPRKYPIRSVVLVRARAEWIDLLSVLSEVSNTKCQAILRWFTFQLSVARKTPALQPFFEIGPDILCVCSPLLIGSDFERNFLKLINLHPELRRFSQLVNQAKEPLALQQLAQLFPSPKFRSEPQVQIPGTTDADLVVYEYSTGFALIIQHKWLIEPETVEESNSNDMQLSEGVRQAEKAIEHFKNHGEALRDALELSSSHPISEIQGVVVCRGEESTGFLGESAVPILAERAFRSLLAGGMDLRSLWQLIHSRPDLAEASTKFEDTTVSIRLGGYEFVLPVLIN
jgi:hypothetical protein